MLLPKNKTLRHKASTFAAALLVSLTISLPSFVGCTKSQLTPTDKAASEIDDFEIGRRMRRNNRSAGLGTGVDEKARDIEKNLGYR